MRVRSNSNFVINNKDSEVKDEHNSQGSDSVMLSEAAGSSQEVKERRSDSKNSVDPDALNHSVSLKSDCDTDDTDD